MVAEIFVRNNVCIGMHHTPIVQQRVRRLSGSGGHHGSVSDIGLDSHPRPMRNSLDGRSSLDMLSQMKATSGTRLPRSRRNSSTNFEVFALSPALRFLYVSCTVFKELVLILLFH